MGLSLYMALSLYIYVYLSLSNLRFVVRNGLATLDPIKRRSYYHAVKFVV